MTVNEWVKAAHEPEFIRHPNNRVELSSNDLKARMFYWLISDELKEMFWAICSISRGNSWHNCQIAIVDALGDIMWLCMTMLTCMGIDWQKVIERIAESNATKLLDGDIRPDEEGRLPKGKSFRPPKLDDLV